MGIPATQDNYVPFDIINKTFAVNYHKHMLKPIEAAGMDTWWLDWQQGEVCVSLAHVLCEGFDCETERELSGWFLLL